MARLPSTSPQATRLGTGEGTEGEGWGATAVGEEEEATTGVSTGASKEGAEAGEDIITAVRIARPTPITIP